MTSPTASPTVPTGQIRRSATAEIVGAERAAETLRPADRRMVDDPYARHFLSSPIYRFLVSTRPTATITLHVFDRLYGGYLAVVLLRDRWFGEALRESLAEGIDQVVLLGAGYDSTALRRDLGGATVYEVDAPPTQDEKRAVLACHDIYDGHVRYVPCDFERDRLVDRLVSAGFDPARRSLIAWWGVSFFLTEAAVRSTLTDVAELTAPGSRLTFDYVDRSVVDGTTQYPGARRATRAVARRGEPYLFGLEPGTAGSFVASFGFEVDDDARLPELARRLGGTHGFPYRTDDFFGVLTARRSAR